MPGAWQVCEKFCIGCALEVLLRYLWNCKEPIHGPAAAHYPYTSARAPVIFVFGKELWCFEIGIHDGCGDLWRAFFLVLIHLDLIVCRIRNIGPIERDFDLFDDRFVLGLE